MSICSSIPSDLLLFLFLQFLLTRRTDAREEKGVLNVSISAQLPDLLIHSAVDRSYIEDLPAHTADHMIMIFQISFIHIAGIRHLDPTDLLIIS